MLATEAVAHRCSSKWLKRPTTLLKETPTQVFSDKICEIFKNYFFIGTPLVVASVAKTDKKETKRHSKK